MLIYLAAVLAIQSAVAKPADRNLVKRQSSAIDTSLDAFRLLASTSAGKPADVGPGVQGLISLISLLVQGLQGQQPGRASVSTTSTTTPAPTLYTAPVFRASFYPSAMVTVRKYYDPVPALLAKKLQLVQAFPWRIVTDKLAAFVPIITSKLIVPQGTTTTTTTQIPTTTTTEETRSLVALSGGSVISQNSGSFIEEEDLPEEGSRLSGNAADLGSEFSGSVEAGSTTTITEEPTTTTTTTTTTAEVPIVVIPAAEYGPPKDTIDHQFAIPNDSAPVKDSQEFRTIEDLPLEQDHFYDSGRGDVLKNSYGEVLQY